MPALTQNLTVEQGSDFRWTFPVETEQGVARQLIGWTARGVVKTHPEAETLHAMDLTCRAGAVVLTIPGAESATWPWRRARYELKLYGPQGQQERHATGEIIVDPQLNDG